MALGARIKAYFARRMSPPTPPPRSTAKKKAAPQRSTAKKTAPRARATGTRKSATKKK